jgi:hypothetical protein
MTGDRALNSELGMGNEKKRSCEAQKLKAESMEQKATEGVTGNAEMKRKRHRAWRGGHRGRRKSPEAEGECASWLN